jgi:hypothetical protein
MHFRHTCCGTSMAGKHASYQHALYCTTRRGGEARGYILWRKVKNGSHDVVASDRKSMCLFKTSRWTWISYSCSWAYSSMSIGGIAPVFLRVSWYMEIDIHLQLPAALSPVKGLQYPLDTAGKRSVSAYATIRTPIARLYSPCRYLN